nr:cytochrome bd-I oxidase subunit CydX [uncultured Duganella sp.]
MWYFAWVLGVGLALAAAIINVMWLESNYAFGQRDEDTTRASFENARRKSNVER